MIAIELDNIGRRFNRDWVFRHVNIRFEPGGRYAILGPNGSGKSTLMKVVLGSLTPSEGSISYRANDKTLPVEKVFEYVSLAAPYVDLIEEFTLKEMVDFHFHFKPFLEGFDARRILDRLELSASEDKPLRYFSSGMKQRVKLAMACCAETPLLLLDEPTTNLDEQAIAWYQQLLTDTVRNRLLFISSNQPEEYRICQEHIRVQDYRDFA